MIKTTYPCRGQERKITYFEGVLAVCLDDDSEQGRAKASAELGKELCNSGGHVANSTRQQCLSAFKSSGWMFIEPNTSCKRAVAAGSGPQLTSAHGRLCTRENGDILIAMPYLNIQLAPDVRNPKELLAAMGLPVVHQYAFGTHHFMTGTPPGVRPLEFAHEIEQRSEVLFAEPEFTEHIPHRNLSRREVQNSGNPWQWDIIDAAAAWELSTGRGVRIGVIDSGFDIGHRDLVDVFNDHSGFFASRIFSAARFKRTKDRSYPNHKHGTFCAGIACARANDEDGIGVAHEADVTALAALQRDLLGSQSTLARAIVYAASPVSEDTSLEGQKGCDVISCSLGPDSADWAMSSTLQNAIDFSVTHGRGGRGTPVFWAAPNDEVPISSAQGKDEVSSYHNTITIGASNRLDQHGGTAFGPELDFLAPGIDVLSLDSGSGTRRAQGTSYAAPCAAGVAALMLAVNPDLSWSEIRRLMQESCDKVGGVTYDADGRHERYGSGRINALKAVKAASGG
jgi:thermitase